MTKRIKATLNGVEYNLTFNDWHDLLKTEPVDEHVTVTTMIGRLKRQKEKGVTNRQVLGIDEGFDKSNKKCNKPVVTGKQRPLYDLRKAFIGRSLA